MEPQVKSAENDPLLWGLENLRRFNGAASKICGKPTQNLEYEMYNPASMEPQVKSAENEREDPLIPGYRKLQWSRK